MWRRSAKMAGMRSLLWVLLVAVFLLNPSFACVDEPEFQFGAAEMRAVVEGDWSITIIAPPSGEMVQATVHVEQAAAPARAAVHTPGGALVRAAYACSRTLLKSAGACIESTQMPLAVTFVSGDASFANMEMSGNFNVWGLKFVVGDLDLVIGTRHVLIHVNADGTFTGPEPTGNGTVSVSRL
jgi:hypothetical protein